MLDRGEKYQIGFDIEQEIDLKNLRETIEKHNWRKDSRFENAFENLGLESGNERYTYSTQHNDEIYMKISYREGSNTVEGMTIFFDHTNNRDTQRILDDTVKSIREEYEVSTYDNLPDENQINAI